MTSFLVALFILLGIAAPALAQVDLSGSWTPLYHEDQPERIPGPEIGDYLALPINEAARARAHAWSASLLTLPEHQCKPHPVAYGYRGPSNMRIQQEVDRQTQRVVKITIYLMWMQQYREIWMDGRPHPPATAAPASVGAAHLAGVLDRQVGRRHARCHDDAHEGGVGPPQRRHLQRPRELRRPLGPPR
jgi:hypothetical protein